MDRDAFLQRLLDSYSKHYNVERSRSGYPANGLPLAASASLHLSESGYFLSRRAQLWSADSDDRVFFFSSPVLTEKVCESSIQFAFRQGVDAIDLRRNPNHMRTVITAIFLCDQAEERAVTAVRKCRLYKSFCFSLKGWAELHAICVHLGQDCVYANRYGRETGQFIDGLLHPHRQRAGVGLSLIRKKHS